MKLHKAAAIVWEGSIETFSYYNFPVEHWKRIRTNNGLVKNHARDQKEDMSNWFISRWRIGFNADRGPATSHLQLDME